jgi:hypothetical protein
MNDRIQQLAEQAHFYQADDNYFTAAQEEFARLIILECIGVADELVNRAADGTWTSDELYTDYNGALWEVKRRIEEHFGVEL